MKYGDGVVLPLLANGIFNPANVSVCFSPPRSCWTVLETIVHSHALLKLPEKKYFYCSSTRTIFCVNIFFLLMNVFSERQAPSLLERNLHNLLVLITINFHQTHFVRNPNEDEPRPGANSIGNQLKAFNCDWRGQAGDFRLSDPNRLLLLPSSSHSLPPTYRILMLLSFYFFISILK